MPANLLKNGNSVSFTLHDVKIFGTNKFQSVTVIATASYRAVRSFNADPIRLYNACAPFIPNGINTKVEDWEFVVVESAGGNLVIPIPAIQADSIVLSKPSKVVFEVDSVEAEDVEKILNAIMSLGYETINYYSK